MSLLISSSSFNLYSIDWSSFIVFSVVCFKVYFKLAIYLDNFPWDAKEKIYMNWKNESYICPKRFSFLLLEDTLAE